MEVKLVWWFPMCVQEPVQIVIAKSDHTLQSRFKRFYPGTRVKWFSMTKEEATRKHRLYCLERAEFFKDRANGLGTGS